MAIPAFIKITFLFAPVSFPDKISLVICAFSCGVPPISSFRSQVSNPNCSGAVRKEMGERTIFNILGPLTNPANASRQLLGVYDKELVEKLAEVLANLGVTRGMSVCGSDGLDEITVTGPTYCCEIKDGELTSYEITPEQFGLSTYPLAELVGGTPEENAQITKDILSGTLKGAKRDVVLMNAGIGIYLGSENLTMEEGIKKAEELINSGKAYEKMEEFVKATQQ